jgi:hypothetical protein
MVPDDGLATTIELTLNAIDAGIPGDLVECGTWMGGSSFAMLLAQRYAYGEIKRPVWMYDSFQGMSPPSPEDGYHARWWWGGAVNLPRDVLNLNFCISPLERMMGAMAALDLVDEARVIPGWLADTLPKNKPQQIAVLRVDCDWYDPVMCVYRELEPLVSVGAPIIIDDYDAWEGCRLATHAYLTEKALPWKIRSAPGSWGAWMIKEEPYVIEAEAA